MCMYATQSHPSSSLHPPQPNQRPNPPGLIIRRPSKHLHSQSCARSQKEANLRMCCLKHVCGSWSLENVAIMNVDTKGKRTLHVPYAALKEIPSESKKRYVEP